MKIKSIHVFFLALTLFSVYRITHVGKWCSDVPDYSAFYRPVGLNIATGKGITRQDGNIATRYPPGFPLIIAFCFMIERYTHIPYKKVLQVIILLSMSSGAVLLFKISNLILNRFTSFVASFLWMIYPLNLWLINRPLSEPVFIPLLYLSIYCFLKLLLKTKYTRNDVSCALLTGILAGISSLIRPINIFLGVLFVLLILSKWLYSRDRKRNGRVFIVSSMLLLGNFVSVLPWELYVYNKTGKIMTLSEGGFYSVRDGITAFAGYKYYRKPLKLPSPVSKVAFEAATLQNSGKLNSFHHIIEFLCGQLRENVLGTFEFIGIKILRAWFGTDSQNPKKESFILIIQIPFFLLSVVGSVLIWRKKRSFVVVIWSIVFYTWAMTVLVLSIVRYMVPVIGLLLIPVGLTVSSFITSSHSTFGLMLKLV